MSRADRWLDAFAEWFASKGGVWQTAIAVLVWSVVAWCYRPLDPNLFRTMAVLTIYSAITQPVLAYCNARSTAKADREQAAIKAEEDEILTVVRRGGGS